MSFDEFLYAVILASQARCDFEFQLHRKIALVESGLLLALVSIAQVSRIESVFTTFFSRGFK